MKRGVLQCAMLVLLGCAVNRPMGYVSHFNAGVRAEHAGRYEEAAAEFDRAAAQTRRPMDRDEAMYRAAQALRHAGRTDEAVERFRWLAEHGADENREDRGAFELVRIHLQRGELRDAEAVTVALCRSATETGDAPRAIQLVLLERDRRDPTGASALSWVEELWPLLRTSALATRLLAHRARLLERMGRFDEALASYENILTWGFVHNPHWDDGGLAYAQLLVTMGRPAEALRVTDRVLSVREGTPIPPGSNERPRFPDVAMFRARLLEESLQQPREAADAYHSIYESFRTSRMRDDALLHEARLRERLHEEARACGLFARVVQEFPCTSAGRHARVEMPARCGWTPAPGLYHECPRRERSFQQARANEESGREGE